MSYKSSKRTAIITGASSGIGLSVARCLIERGDRVVVNARREAPLRKLASSAIEDNIRVVVGDCQDSSVMENMLHQCEEAFGTVPDLFLLNAGRGLPGTITSSDETQWDDLFNVNVLAPLRHLRMFSSAMVKDTEDKQMMEKARDIVVLGSSIGRNISPFNPIYGATKFAIHSATEALRREIGPKGIRVSLIEPGIVQTEFQAVAGYDPQWFEEYVKEIGPILQPEDIAKNVMFIIDQPAHIHVNDIMIRPTRQSYP